MKPALFYAIKRGYREYRIIAVTTEKPRNWHGRNVTDNTATHGTNRELIGRFDTQEAAQAKVDEVAKIIAHHAPIIEAACAGAGARTASRDRIAFSGTRRIGQYHPPRADQ